MARAPNLRQIEAFKAVIETGTVSRAAQTLHISQPAASKLLAHLEADIGLQLFERERGKLRPTERGIRLYEEVDRIFAGLRQIERAVESIRREEQGQLTIGIMPGLSGPFICEVVKRFLDKFPNVYVSLTARSSQFIVDWMSTRQLDLGIVTTRVENGHLETESLMNHPLVCVLPLGHRLARKSRVTLEDIADEPFVSFAPGSYTRIRLDEIFAEKGLKPNVVLDATTAPNVCELVAAGIGVTLEHPLLVQSVRGRVAVRPFEPARHFDFLMCRPRSGRNRKLVDAFMQETRETAEAVSREMLTEL